MLHCFDFWTGRDPVFENQDQKVEQENSRPQERQTFVVGFFAFPDLPFDCSPALIFRLDAEKSEWQDSNLRSLRPERRWYDAFGYKTTFHACIVSGISRVLQGFWALS